MISSARETRVIAASPRARLSRLDTVDRQLLLLLVSLGAEPAQAALAGLCEARREALTPLVAEVRALEPEERYALFAELPGDSKPNTQRLNARLRQEPTRIAALLVRELAPRKAAPMATPSACDPRFARTLGSMAAQWLKTSRG